MMEATTKSVIWLIATLLTGLSAGFFYSWQVSVIPGTKLINARNYIETMQSINRAIINPAFLLIFIGPFLMQILAIYQFRGTSAMAYLLAACLCYFLGTLLVTVLGNVPLNNSLDLLNSNNMSPEQLDHTRLQYALKWNRLHTLRTVFAVLSFILMLIPTLTQLQYSIQQNH
ncbi:MAG: DUF1772 domain-containing protein [Thermodesulfobacteriota bacterium]|nr:DUF1772 domain-containing protein [Thermodesulfobacteriota bacterium]